MADGELWVNIKGDTSSLQEATRRGSEEMKAFAREAQAAGRIIEATKDPIDKLADKQERLNELYQKGHLDANQYRRAVEQLGNEYEQIKRKQQGLDKPAFGKTALSSVGSYVASLGTLAAAIGLVRTGLEGMAQDAERGLASLKGNVGGDKRLVQVSGGSSAELTRLQKLADSVALNQGISRADARELVFSAKSEGFDDQLTDVAGALSVTSADAIAGSAGGFRGAFKGVQDMSGMQAMSMILRGAESSKFNFESLTEQVRRGSESALTAGTNPFELTAATASLGQKFGESTGSRIKALQSFIAKTPQAAGKGLLGGLDALQEMQSIDSEGFKQMINGNAEARDAFAALSILEEEVRALTGTLRADFVATEQGGGAMRSQIRVARGNAPSALAREANRAEVQREIDEEQRGMQKLARQTAFDRVRSDQRGNRVANATLAGLDALGVDESGVTSSIYDLYRKGMKTGSFGMLDLPDFQGLGSAEAGSVNSSAMLQRRIAETLEKGNQISSETLNAIKAIESDGKTEDKPTVISNLP